MVEVSSVRAVLFVKDLSNVTSFYSEALGMACGTRDDSHALLNRGGFELIIQQIPKHIADGIDIDQPPVRRVGSAVRLDYAVENIQSTRRLAKSLGGDIDETPPSWADGETSFYLGYDPEGNVFGVSQQVV